MFEDDLIIFSGLIKYLQTLPEGTVDMRNFDPLEFYSFINDQYLELREPLVLTTTRLWDISVNNTRASTAKFRALHGTGGKPKVAFASPVQGGINNANATDANASATPKQNNFRGHNVNTAAPKSFPAYTPANAAHDTDPPM